MPNPSSPSESKQALRAALLTRRATLAVDAQREARLAARIEALLARLAPQCVGFYWPTRNEYDARALLARWLASAPLSRHAALPVVDAAHGPLQFHRWSPDTPMLSGRFGIAVPRAASAVTPDLLLIPCVGFDAAGYRLGYGGGYYDRTLASLQPRPRTIGIGYECLRVATLPREPHDIPLDAVLTEAGCYPAGALDIGSGSADQRTDTADHLDHDNDAAGERR